MIKKSIDLILIIFYKWIFCAICTRCIDVEFKNRYNYTYCYYYSKRRM